MPWNRIGPYPGAYYKHHWACFNCRIMVRKPSHFEARWKHMEAWRTGSVLCPYCKSPLRNMGKAFRPPLRSAVVQWKKIERQYLAGVRWSSGRW